MVQTGSQEDFIFTDETTYGDGGDFTSIKFRLGQNIRIENLNLTNNYRYVRGGKQKPSQRVVGEKDNRFDLVFSIDKWQFLKYITNVATETGSDPYTHNITIPDTDFNGGGTFAFQRILSSDEAYLYKGVKPINMKIGFQKGQGEAGFLTCTLSCICQDVENVATNDIETLAESTRNLFHFYTCKLTTASNEIVEISSGNYMFNWNVNPDDSRYCNATLSELIGEPIYTELTEELQLSINTLDTTFITQFLSRTELSGTNTLEFIYNDSNNKVTFTFEHMYNEGGTPPTQFGEVTKTEVLYVPIINTITVIDNIQNY